MPSLILTKERNKLPNYYKTQKGFSYFFVPDCLLELRPMIDGFTLDLWLLLHSRIQHNQRGPWALLTDDQITNNPMWGDRSISAKEVSRSRKLLKQLGVLSYRKDGLAWHYFAVHPVSGVAIDPGQAEIERRDSVEPSRVAQLEAELAILKKQLEAKPSSTPPAPARRVPVQEDYDPYDTGAVLD